MLGGDCEMRTRIRDLREKKGLTLGGLAAKVDMNLELEMEEIEKKSTLFLGC